MPATYPHADLTRRIIGAAIEVHRQLGPGLLESVYEQCLAQELSHAQIPHVRQAWVPITYRGEQLNTPLRIDLIVDSKVLVEIKSIASLARIHDAQLLTYLKLAQIEVGLIINFNVPVLTDGVRRKVFTIKPLSDG